MTHRYIPVWQLHRGTYAVGSNGFKWPYVGVSRVLLVIWILLSLWCTMQLVWQKFGYIVTWRYVTVWHPLGGFSCGNYHFSHSKVWNQMSLYRYSIAFYAKNLVGKLHATSLFGFKYDGVDVYHMHLCILDFFKVDYITLFSHGVSFIVFGICQLYFVSPGIKVVIFVWYSYI